MINTIEYRPNMMQTRKSPGVLLGIHQNLWFPRVVETRKLPAPSSERYISCASASFFIHLITHTENEGVKGHRNEFLFLLPSTCSHVCDTCYMQIRAGGPPKTFLTRHDDQLPSMLGVHGLKNFLCLCSAHLLESFDGQIYTY